MREDRVDDAVGAADLIAHESLDARPALYRRVREVIHNGSEHIRYYGGCRFANPVGEDEDYWMYWDY